MGDSPDRRAMITRLCWWLAEVLCRTLQPDEREAVLGDLAERGELGMQALRDVLGLVIRRQAAMWTDWRPWLTLVAVIVPLAMLLSLASRQVADESAVYTWLYVNNWKRTILGNAGFWFVAAESAGFLLTAYFKLVCWAWTAGLVLGFISRRMQLRMNGVLLCLTLLFAEFVAAPRYLAYWRNAFSLYPRRSVHVPPFHAPTFAQTFYHQALFPVLVQAVLVAVPAMWAMLEGAKAEKLDPTLRTALWTLAVLTVAAILTQTPGLGFFLWAFSSSKSWHSWQILLPRVVVYWPVAYIVSCAVARRRQERLAAV